MKLKIYLAGPISGMGYEEVQNYFNRMYSLLTNAGYKVFSPMTGKSALRTEKNLKAHGIEGVPIATNHAIFNRDKWMVTQQADVVFANFTRGKGIVSIGTMMELAWASYTNKHVVVALPKDDIHQHAFVLEAANVVFETEDEALEYLYQLSQ